MVLRILSLTARLSHPPPHRAASGGGAPCVTAGDTRAERGGTRGKMTALISDAGGGALKASRKYHSSIHQEKTHFCCHTINKLLIHTFSVSYPQSVAT